MRVKPILKYGLIAGALALPGAAYPLGLGRLTVESFVGQPLVARIELLASSKEELDSLTARVADPSLYRQNNLLYQGVLSRTRVTLERGAGDTAFLKVTSGAPVSEPYLDLLVEVNSTSGRVVRDYTFLLDPPGTVAAPIEPITPMRSGAAPTVRPPAAAAAAAPAPPAPAPPVVAAPAGAAPAATAPRGQGDTYEVKRGDTLSKIAQNYKPETVTLDQMLVALFNSNQNAFDGANMNRPAFGLDHNDPERGGSIGAIGVRGHEGGARAVGRLARLSRSRRGGGANGRRSRQSRRRRTDRHRGRREDACRASGQRSIARVQGSRHGQGPRCCRNERRPRSAIAGSAKPHRRPREDAQGSAARRRNEESDDGAVANAVRGRQSQGRAAAAGDSDHDGAPGRDACAGYAASESRRTAEGGHARGGATEGRTAEGGSARSSGAAEGRTTKGAATQGGGQGRAERIARVLRRIPVQHAGMGKLARVRW